MPSTDGTSLHLDLGRRHCTQFLLSGSIMPDQSQMETLSGMVKAARQRQEWPWAFGERYRAGSEWYAVETFLFPAKQAGALAIQVVFSPGRQLSPRAAAVGPMLEVLSNSDVALTVTCRAHFDYPQDEGISTIPLPFGSPEAVAVPEGPKMRFQVRGLRITQVDEEGSEDFSIVIDRPDNEEFHHSVSFERISPLSGELMAQLFDRASEISRIFFSEEEKSGSSKVAKERNT